MQNPAAAADLQAAAASNPGAAAEPGESAGPDYAAGAAALVDMVVAMIVGYEPRCAQFWPEERKLGVAAAAAPVMEKYNFTLDKIPPEFTLLILAGPPLYQCSKLIAETMNNPQPGKAASAIGAGAPGVKPDTLSGQEMLVPGKESGTATHSQAMMELST